MPIIGNACHPTRDALDAAAFKARKRITLVSLMSAALVFAVFLFAHLIRRRRCVSPGCVSPGFASTRSPE